MAQKQMNEKEIEKKLKDLKLEVLKQGAKRKDIKKEIAKLLTLRKQNSGEKNKQ